MSLATVTTFEVTGQVGSQVQTEIDFIDVILFDDNTDIFDSPIVISYGGAPEFSMERWVRFRFDGSFSKVNTVKVWAPDHAFPVGWSFRAGSSATYQTPVSNRSDIAVNSIPTTKEEAVGVSSGDIVPGGYSDYLVLQAVADGQASEGVMDSDDVALRLYWMEAI